MHNQRIWLGTVFVVTGVLLLLNTLGMLSWTVWWRLFEMWPVLLISIGLTMVFGHSRLSLLGPLLLVAAAGFAVWLPVDGGGFEGTSKVFSAPLEPQIKQGQIQLEVAAGQVRLGAGTEVATAVISESGRIPRWEYRREGDTAVVRLTSPAVPQPRWFRLRHHQDWYTEVKISSSIPWEIDMNCGAGKIDADFTKVRLQRLTADLGVGKLDMSLGDTGEKGEITVEGGVGSVQIRVPKTVGLRVETSGGLNVNNLAELGLTWDGKQWVSPNWNTASSRYDIKLSTGIGKVSIMRIPSGRSI